MIPADRLSNRVILHPLTATHLTCNQKIPSSILGISSFAFLLLFIITQLPNRIIIVSGQAAASTLSTMAALKASVYDVRNTLVVYRTDAS